MKCLLHTIFFVSLTAAMLCGCHRSHRSELERVDRCLSTDIPDTDKARRMLDSVASSAASFSESDRMYYIMLLADLQNKSFEQLPPDSLMRTMVSYYDRHGSANERMRAYYLMGSFYRDRKSQVEAQENFHKAVSAADTAAPDCNFRLLARVYGQLADLYRFRSALAVNMYNSAKYYALKGRDTMVCISAADNQIECYRNMQRYDTVIGIARWCQMMYERIGIPQKGSSLWLAMSDAYVERADFDSAAYCLHQYEQTSNMVDDNYNVRPGMNRESYYTYKGHYYLKKGRLDSALIFYYKELHTNKQPYVMGACDNLSITYELIGNKDSVNKYLTLYLQYRNRRDSTLAVSQLQELQVHFDVNRERVRTEKYQGWTRLLLSVAAALALGWAVWLLHAYRRNSRNRRKVAALAQEVFELKRDRTDKALQIERLKSDGAERDRHIGRLTAELQCTERILEIKEKELQQAEKRIPRNRRTPSETANPGEPPAIGLMRQKAALKLPVNGSDEAWDVALSYMQEHAPALLPLLDNAPVSERDVRVCLLVWAHFSPTDMSVLLAMSKQNITSVRARLHQMLFGEEGTSRDFDERIRRIAPYPFGACES